MPFNIDIFNTYYMAGMVQEIVPMQTFFKDRYFPTGAGDIFNSDKVLVEYEAGDHRMAPFVVEHKGDIEIDRIGYQIHEFEPPYIAPSRLTTLDHLNKRGFGEALLSTSTPEERARLLHIKDLSDLDKRITRREEWMAAMTMINNGCPISSYIDNKKDTKEYIILYYDQTKGNNALYTVSTLWDSDNGVSFFSDVKAMCKLLTRRGLPAADLILGSDVADTISDVEKVRELLDNRRMEYGSLAPSVTYPGVAFMGTLNFGGFKLNLFDVDETYVDDNGDTQSLFPAKSAMVTAPGCGHMMYGRIDQMEPDKQFHSFPMTRVPKLVVDEENDTRKLRLASRPLAAPKQYAPWIYAADVIS